MSPRAQNRAKNTGRKTAKKRGRKKRGRQPGDIWLRDEDAQLEHRIAHRQTRPGGLPDAGDLVAMDLLVTRLLHASVLLQDITDMGADTRADSGTGHEAPLRPAGLSYVANALNRDATRLFRLYHGRPPNDV